MHKCTLIVMIMHRCLTPNYDRLFLLNTVNRNMEIPVNSWNGSTEPIAIPFLVGVGLKWHCLIWAIDMLPPKLMHILGCLAFSDFFFASNQILKYNGKSFFWSVIIYSETLQFFLIVVIWDFIEKLPLELSFDLGKCPNYKTYTFTFMPFLVRALPEVQNCFCKQFLNKVLYSY